MFHAYVPLSTTRNHISIKRYSSAATATTVQIAKLRETLPMYEINGYVICEYDKQWWLALVLRTMPDTEEVEVRFLEPAGPSPSFTFPKRNDDLVIAQGHVLLVVNPTTQTGRTYQLSMTGISEATAKLKMRNI